MNDLMRSSFAQALTQEKLTPAAGPAHRAHRHGPGRGPQVRGRLRGAARRSSVQPLGSIGDRASVARRSPRRTSSAMIESMRRQRPVFTAVERAAQETDRVTARLRRPHRRAAVRGRRGPRCAGRSSASEPGHDGTGRWRSKAPRRARLARISLAFPAEHPNKDLAGKTAELEVTVKQVEEQNLPAVDEAFCRAYGVEEGGIEALRGEVRKSMERELAGRHPQPGARPGAGCAVPGEPDRGAARAGRRAGAANAVGHAARAWACRM